MSPPLSPKAALALLIQGRGTPGMRVTGALAIPSALANAVPPDLHCDLLSLTDWPLAELPEGLTCYELNLSQAKVRRLPQSLRVESILNCSNCTDLAALPAGLTVGTLNLQGCQSLTKLPEGLDVWFLDLSRCWAFHCWPRVATIRSGRLNLRGCTALTGLPEYFGTLASVNIRDCPSLKTLPEGLRISGWIDVAQSGVAAAKKLPASLAGVELRWQGVRIEERVLCRPETITVTEILAEANAERRRVLTDRYGLSRFMADCQPDVLDEDTDTGGKRRLLRMAMNDDEPIVTLSCSCPSTQRHYFLRVPPAMATCHQAAAWIAGFDNPDDYRPLWET